MLADRMRFRFSLKSVFVLFLGIAIGFALHLPLRQFVARLLHRPAAPQPYVIEPPDVLRIDVFDPNSGDSQPVSSEHSVGPEGQVHFNGWGSIYVAGMTIDEARTAIEKAIGKYVSSAKVAVDVIATKSKKVYVITERSAGRASVRSLPTTGNDTVLDAVTRAGGIVNPNTTQVRIVRPPTDGVGVEATLSVDWAKVASSDPTATNIQLNAGDRVFITPKTLPAGAQ